MQRNTSNLPTNVKLEKAKPYNRSIEDASILEAFLCACKLYFNLSNITELCYQVKMALLWLKQDAAVWWQNHKALASVKSSHLGSVVWASQTTILPGRCCALRKGCMGIMHLRKRFGSKLR